MSGHLLVARTAIENPNWKWENWPSLKTLELKNENRLELRHTRTSVRTSPVFSAKYAIEAMNKICFNQCPSLEKVNLTVYFDLEELQFAANVQQQSFTGNLLRGISGSFLWRQLMIANYCVKKFVRKSQQSKQTLLIGSYFLLMILKK